MILEIVRVSHCGHFKYEGRQYTGCVQACDTDGCNAAAMKPAVYETGIQIILAMLIIISLILDFDFFLSIFGLNLTYFI